MHTLDLVVLGVYLSAVVALGARFSRRQATIRDYFLTDHQVPWWALCASIIATETSTVTLISVPGYAFGGDLTFLQLALGYVVGKIFVAVVLIPRFFRGHLLTAYQPLSERFGPVVGRVTALIFLGTRSLSDGFRLFATGLVLAAVLGTLPTAGIVVQSLLPSMDLPAALLVVSVSVIGGTTLAYTLIGGMRAVIWTDVVQLIVYMTGALIAALMVLSEIPGGWTEVVNLAGPAEKLVTIDLTFDLTKSYTFWSGVIGGMFLTAGTHGTDQMFVQRYLCSRSPRDASRALIWSGVFVLIQFALFLGHRPPALGVLHRLLTRRVGRHHRRWHRANRPHSAHVHDEPSPGRAAWPRRGGDRRRGDVYPVVIAELLGRLAGWRFLRPSHRRFEIGWPLPRRLPLGDCRVGAGPDCRGGDGD